MNVNKKNKKPYRKKRMTLFSTSNQILAVIIVLALVLIVIDFSLLTMIGSLVLGLLFGIWKGNRIRTLIFKRES